jgi:hypothetical protein
VALDRAVVAGEVGPIVLGGLALLGWVLHVEALTSVVPGLPSMKANSAIGLVLGGVALALVRDAHAGPRRLGAGITLGAAAGLIGAVTLIEHVAGGMGVDELLFAEPGSVYPGRASPHTAVTLRRPALVDHRLQRPRSAPGTQAARTCP